MLHTSKQAEYLRECNHRWNFKGVDWIAEAGSYNEIQGPVDGIFEAGIRERRTAFPAANYFSVTFEKFLMEI